MNKFYLFLILLLSSFNLVAQQKQALKSGEKLVYTASYNFSGLMTQIAQVIMETETVKTSKKTLLHLSCQASTYSNWDSYFKIRDLYESYVDPITLQPSLYKRDVLEGKYTKKEKYIFKNNGQIIESTVSKNKSPEIKKTFNIESSTQDGITTIYQLRRVDFSKFKVGQIKTFYVVFDEKQTAVSAKYMGKEVISAGNLGKKECYKISIGSKTKVLKGTDKNIIWLTADAKKIPALIKFSIRVGTGELILTNATGI